MGVRKLSVALSVRVVEQARASAESSGRSLSAWLNDAAETKLLVEDGLRAVAEHEAEHGPLPALEKRRAQTVLERAGVRPRSATRRPR